jgi:hypothetical protein
MMAALDCVTLHAKCGALNPSHPHALAQLHDRTFEAQERPMSAAHSSMSTCEYSAESKIIMSLRRLPNRVSERNTNVMIVRDHLVDDDDDNCTDGKEFIPKRSFQCTEHKSVGETRSGMLLTREVWSYQQQKE